jgi:hypothetical protein
MTAKPHRTTSSHRHSVRVPFRAVVGFPKPVAHSMSRLLTASSFTHRRHDRQGRLCYPPRRLPRSELPRRVPPLPTLYRALRNLLLRSLRSLPPPASQPLHARHEASAQGTDKVMHGCELICGVCGGVVRRVTSRRSEFGRGAQVAEAWCESFDEMTFWRSASLKPAWKRPAGAVPDQSAGSRAGRSVGSRAREPVGYARS